MKLYDVFISYSARDLETVKRLARKLEDGGLSVWYTHRDNEDDYAGTIVEALDKSRCFVLVASSASLDSQHVLAEVDLAFQRRPDDITFKILRLDPTPFPPAFRYYLSCEHWAESDAPTMEERIEAFAKYVMEQ